MDTKTRDMVRGWLAKYGGDTERVARYMSQSLALGSLPACRRLVAEAVRDNDREEA